MNSEKMCRGLCAIFLAIALLFAATACADSISFDGTVTASEKITVFAPIGGIVEQLLAEVGDTVAEGDPIARLKTTKVYAQADGVVSGIFGQIGDSAETVANRYGAVMYVEEQAKYTISASTSNAYAKTENKFVHIGETVYIKATKDSSHTAVGRITAADGIDYTVEFQSGDLMNGESVEIFREADYTYVSRLGKGTVSRKSPTAVTGTGSIAAIHVRDGQAVKRGDLLMETLEGTFDGLYMSGMEILAPASGTVGELSLQLGQTVQKDAAVATLYPQNAMRFTGEVSESDLGYLRAGDKAIIELNWNADEEIRYQGTVRSVSAVATAAEGSETGNTGSKNTEATFTVRVDFVPDTNIRYGMTGTATVGD